MTERCWGLHQLKISAKHLLECVCTCETTKRSCGECLIVCAKPKSQPYHPATTAKKRRCCSLQNRRINIYTVARTICQSVGGSRDRRRWRKARQDQASERHVWTFRSIRACTCGWVCQVSHTCAPVGFGLPPPGVSACCAPGFLFMLLLEESCWYEVSHSLWHPPSLVQHVEAVSHLHVHKKSKVEGSLNILIKPAVDRRFMLKKKTLASLGLLFTLFLPTCWPCIFLCCLSLLAYLTPIRNVNTCHDVTHFVQVSAHAPAHTHTHTHTGANWQGHIWDVLLKSVSFYQCKY